MGSRLRWNNGYASILCLGGWKVILPAVYVVLFVVLNAGGVWGQAADDHGDSFATATNLPLGSSVAGRIDPGDDRDVFRLDLSSRRGSTDVWIYTSGDLDSLGWLYDSSENLLVHNDDGFIGSQQAGFHIRWVLPRGVYYVAVRGFRDTTTGQRQIGSYRVHAQAVTDPGGTIGAATRLGIGSLAPGRIDNAENADYFRMDFSKSTNLVVRAINLFRVYRIGADTIGIRPIAPLDVEVLDAEGAEISVNIYETTARINGERQPAGFSIRDDFGPGTYYFRVTTPGGVTSHPVPYTIHALEDTEYTEFIEGCEARTRSLDNPQISDPLYSCQWHLNSAEGVDINVEAAWAQGVTGEGVNVAVVDDGMYFTHEDLKDNVDTSRNHDYTGRGSIYTPLEHHGTHVSGIIAARDNGIGVRGVAPRATVYGYNYLAGPTTVFHAADAMTRNRVTTAVSNNSWGPRDGPGVSMAESFWERAVSTSLTAGYGGKGVFYAFAAGNGHGLGDDSNLDELANYYGVTAVCAVNDHDTRSSFSEMGANLWVCAPSNDLTDLHQGILTTENNDRYLERVLRDVSGGSDRCGRGRADAQRQSGPDMARSEAGPRQAPPGRTTPATPAGRTGLASMGPRPPRTATTSTMNTGSEWSTPVPRSSSRRRWITAPPLQESSVSSGSMQARRSQPPVASGPDDGHRRVSR